MYRALAFFLLLLTACTGGSVRPLSPNAQLPTKVALLPQAYSGEIARERVDFIRQTVTAELKNKGFTLIDEKVVAKTCSAPTCPERDLLVKTYGVKGFAKLDVKSLSQNSFLAGFVNVLSGDLTFSDSTGKDLLNIEHQESEKGGLLFQSGQVFQGISEQADNAGDGAFNKLANKFALNLVELIPAGNENASLSAAAPEVPLLTAISAKWLNNSGFEICADVTGSTTPYVLAKPEKIPLRKVSANKFCGAFGASLEDRFSDGVTIEARSAYGEVERKKISFDAMGPCNLDGRVNLMQTGLRDSLKIVCASGASECIEKSCSIKKVLVFRSNSIKGPFKKVGETENKELQAQRMKSEDIVEYQVIGLSSRGVPGLPVSAKKIG